MEEIKNKVEAVLFAAGKKVDVEYIAKLCRSNREEVLAALKELQKQYEEKGSLLISEEGESWKINVREAYSPIVRKIVPATELTKTMIATLAVIAWKSPVLQSEVIRIRTNKAYDHIAEIEEAGFISREKHGRTNLIKLTQRFYDYFDVHNEQEIKDKFRNVKDELDRKIDEKRAEHAAKAAKPTELLSQEPKTADLGNENRTAKPTEEAKEPDTSSENAKSDTTKPDGTENSKTTDETKNTSVENEKPQNELANDKPVTNQTETKEANNGDNTGPVPAVQEPDEVPAQK